MILCSRWGLGLVVLGLTLPALARADRVIFLPSARKISMSAIKSEWLLSNAQQGTGRAMVGFGVGQSFELEIDARKEADRGWTGTFNFAYNYLEPLKDLLPGLAAGFRDVLNRTADGRVLYACATFATSTDNMLGFNAPVDVTLGLKSGNASGAYVGVILPFTDYVSLLAEADRQQITAGVRIQPMRGLQAQLVVQRKESFWGLSYSLKF